MFDIRIAPSTDNSADGRVPRNAPERPWRPVAVVDLYPLSASAVGQVEPLGLGLVTDGDRANGFVVVRPAERGPKGRDCLRDDAPSADNPAPLVARPCAGGGDTARVTASPRHSVSVAGVVVDADDRVLVIQRRDNGHWEMPGGVLELDENIEDGLRREVAEETGMTVQVERLTGVYKNLTRGIVALVFRCRPGLEPAQSTLEARQIRWMTCDEVRDVMTPAYAIRVLDAFDSQPSVRSHDGVQLIAT
jgi:8-oxo-dGTP diphosphatase